MMNSREVFDALVAAIPFYNKREYTAFLKSDPKKDYILSNNPNMLMAMWVMSANFNAEKASLIPFILMERLKLNEFNMHVLAAMDVKEIENAMLYPTPIHRFCKKRAGYLHEMAKMIVSQYAGDAKNIWEGASADEITRRLLEFKGFGPKLSSMVPINLIRNFNMKLKNIEKMDIAVDVHVERVLKRTGISEINSSKEQLEFDVRKLAELKKIYPMELDLPLWATGRFFCHEHSPLCTSCPICPVCPKIFFAQSQNSKTGCNFS